MIFLANRRKKEYTEFNKNLKKLREQTGYSINEFAQLLDLPRNTYIAYENQNREPSFSVLLKMAQTLQVTTDELLGYQLNELDNYIKIAECLGFKVEKNYDGSPSQVRVSFNSKNIGFSMFYPTSIENDLKVGHEVLSIRLFTKWIDNSVTDYEKNSFRLKKKIFEQHLQEIIVDKYSTLFEGVGSSNLRKIIYQRIEELEKNNDKTDD